MSSDGSADGVDAQERDVLFPDVPVRDGTLACDDQQVQRLRVGGDLEPSPQRYVRAAAADGDELVLFWLDQDAEGGLTGHAGRIRDPFAPIVERLPEPLPRPEISALLPTAGGLRVLFNDSRSGPPTDWADLRADNTFGPVSPLDDVPPDVGHLGAGRACQGDATTAMAAFVWTAGTDAVGVLVLEPEEDGFRYLDRLVPDPATTRSFVNGCLVRDGAVTVLLTNDWNAPVVVQWSIEDGSISLPRTTVGSGPAGALLAADAEGVVVFHVTGVTSPTATAYRIADGAAAEVATTTLDPLYGAGWWPVPQGAFPLGSGLLLLYNYADILFLLPFSDESGFAPAALLTDAGCRERLVVSTPEGTFLPCTAWDPIYLLAMCRNGEG